MPYKSPFDKTRLVYSWLDVGGPCMWHGCQKKSEHVHHIQPRRFRGCSHDANLIALCREHHGGGNGEIHAKWEDHEMTLRDFRELAFKTLLPQIEFKALRSAIRDYQRRLKWAVSNKSSRYGHVHTKRECDSMRQHIVRLKKQVAGLEVAVPA